MKFETPAGQIYTDIAHVIVAGWTGRDSNAVNHHISELSELGVAPPSQVPLFYRIASAMLIQSKKIEVLGSTSSGEAEPLLIKSGNEIWLGLASDHTDRKLETYSVAYSKQACLKPIANNLWKLSEVQDHQDELILRSWVIEDDQWRPYQQGTLSMILPLNQLLEAAELPENAALLCGTLPAIGGIRSADKFCMELFDPILDRKIRFTYRIESLPIIA